MRGVNQGFTLIELMIAVAIIAVLVAVGVPQYQNYVARSQAIEGVNLAGGIKTALAEYYNTNGAFPKDTTDSHVGLGLEPATSITGKYVASVTVSDDGFGTITAEFGSGNHAGKFVRLTPVPVASGSIYFDCDSDIEESYRPKECIEGSLGPTPLEIAEAELEAAIDNSATANANFTTFIDDNNASWPLLNSNGVPITTNWSAGLTPEERAIKAAYYWKIRSDLERTKGNDYYADTYLRYSQLWLNSGAVTSNARDTYNDLVQAIEDAAQAVEDAQTAVTDLGG